MISFIMKMLIKVYRLAAWVLYVGMFVYFVTGFGMTKGIIDRELATKIHLGVLNQIMIGAFLVHSSYAIHLALKRWKMWNIFSQLLLILIFFGSIIFSIKIFNEEKETKINNQQISKEKVFTINELAKFDGQNGNPPYVAVDGVVYDMTEIFQAGKHYSHFAGQELTKAFYLKHVKSQITKYPTVGRLIDK